jgi:cellulose synthase/poly-beta-1,6-N-acetylglucosamine synthase-like glycosyltransferase
MINLSIIVTAFKEEKTIGKAIKQIISQLPKSSEILVIAPDEPTLSVAKKLSKKDKRIKILKDPGRGKPTALNLGFKEAKGKILILTDGDVLVGKNSIKFLLKHFENPKVGAVSGKVIYQISKNFLFYEWAKLSEKVFDKMRKIQDKKNELWHPTGYLYAIRNGLVKKIPSNVLSDDALIGYMIKSKGYLIKYEPKAKVYVKFPTSISDFIKQKSRTRAGFLQIKRWFGFEGRKISSEISIGSKDLFKIYGIRKFHKMLIVSFVYIISWLRAYWLIFRRKSFEKIWERIETTK